ncbi:hypothetical protein LSH36_396g05024 [Paralvinella palmiformis]|uniref:Uncharacterized protein n=1 Tax=Paralvinella palmiformis TaxID=53620 RepID=A0AAD9MYZ6_9ANNE|nr:hypothetical protein LSH36_396g05024 [Paralvinella palmiformis]
MVIRRMRHGDSLILSASDHSQMGMKENNNLC